MYFLGGHTIVGAGWVNAQTVFVDFVSQYSSGWLWQLYANRRMIGATRVPGERRVVGQIVASDLPAPLTLVRVDVPSLLTDYGPDLPRVPWNRFKLEWSAAGMPTDTDHFDVVSGVNPGDSIDLGNVLARVPYVGAGNYEFELQPFAVNGAWNVGVVPRDDAFPLGNAGTPATLAIDVASAPADVLVNEDGSRFTATIAGGILTVDFAWGAV